MPRLLRLVVLSCLHTLTFDTPAPSVGEYVFCFRCNAYRRAAQVPDAYTVDCLDCTRGRKEYSGNHLRAEIAADKHARKFPGHRVRVLNRGEVLSERAHAPEPDLLDVPPF